MEVPPPPEFAKGWATVYAAVWLAILALVVVFTGDQNLPFLLFFALVWIGLHLLILRFGARLRGILSIAVALLIIGAGQFIPALHRLDAALLPHRPTLRPLLLGLVAAGFAMFMGGILHLVLTKTTREPEKMSFAELKSAWQSGSWRDSPRVKRLFVIGGGVLLAITAGVAMAVVFAPPGLKLLMLLVWGYAMIRIWLGLSFAGGEDSRRKTVRRVRN